MQSSVRHSRWSWLSVFVLLCACGGGNSATPPAPTAPVISSFSSTPTATNAGRSASLSWAVSGATSLTLQPGAINVTGQTSYPISPVLSTTYTLQASNAAGTTSANSAVRIYDWTQTANALDSYVASAGASTVTGYSFIAFDRSGTLFMRAGGDQTVDTIRLLASASKLPTVAAILTLVDSGQINLDTPVAQYLATDASFNWPSDKSAITMRMLLAHTAGIVGLNDGQPACLGQPNTLLRDCAQIIATTALIAAPGASFNYGGADFQVAAYIATLLTASPSWQNFFAARIGTPLSLTAFTYGAGNNPRVAGGASSNIADYARFLQMIQGGGLFNGTRVLSTAMVAELERDQIAGLPIAYSPIPAGLSALYPGYGLGVFISSPTLYPGSSGPEFSDPGAFGTTPWFDNGLGYGAVLLILNTTQTGFNIWNAVRPLIITQLTTG